MVTNLGKIGFKVFFYKNYLLEDHLLKIEYTVFAALAVVVIIYAFLVDFEVAFYGRSLLVIFDANLVKYWRF